MPYLGATPDTTIDQKDLNGQKLIIDADADTSIHASTDDQIDVEVAGADVLQIKSSSGDAVIKAAVDAKDILFQQYDGRTILDVNDGGYVAITNGATGAGQLRLYEDTDNGTNYSAFQVGTQSGDITYTLPTADGSDGHALKTDGSGTLSWGAVAANTPSSADGQALGSASLEWSDLYLADGSVIYFGNDQDVTVTHDPDDGLFLKSTATSDDNPFLLTLQTGETDMAADDVIGKISFQAPDEGTGTDAILVSAAIQARAEGDFSSSSNATSLDFMTGSSEAATTKMTLASDGKLTVKGELAIAAATGVLETNANFVDQVIFGPAVDGRAWKGLWNKASLFSSLMLATLEQNGSDAEINIWDLTEQSSGAISTTPLATIAESGTGVVTGIAAAMGYVIIGCAGGVYFYHPHDGAWKSATYAAGGWPRYISNATAPALTNNDVQAVCAGLADSYAYDPRTLGPMPTFGVAYGTGADSASIIKSDHTVIDRAGTSGAEAGCAIVNGYFMYRGASGDNSGSLFCSQHKIHFLAADDWDHLAVNRDNSANMGFGIDHDLSSGLDDFYAAGSNEGVSFGYLGQGEVGQSFRTLNCMINRTFNTGFMVRTTRGCWLANSHTADRDANAHTLTNNGTITEAAVASGAELKGYSGWSTSNYLNVASHASWDEVGTGSVCWSTWFKAASNSSHEFMASFHKADGAIEFAIRLNSDGTVTGRDDGATAEVDTTSSKVFDDSVWHKMDFIRSSSTERYLYVDGVLEASNTTDAGSLSDDGNLPLVVGASIGGTEPATNCTMALTKLFITPPTADQIKTAYELERRMFEANAECLLQSGTTDAVLGSAVDPLTGKVLVTQTDAITIFDGCVVDSKPTVNSGNSEKGRLWGDLRTEQNSANVYVSAPAHDQAQVNEMVRGISSGQIPKGYDMSKAKAWVNYDPSTGSVVMKDSYNIKSVAVAGAGNYNINLGQPLKDDELMAISVTVGDDAAYAIIGSYDANPNDANYGQIKVYTNEHDGSWTAFDSVSVIVFGELQNE